MSPPAISTLLQRHWRGLIATASLVLLTVWIARNTYWTEVSVPSPEKGEAASDPFYAAGRLVRLLGARTSMSRGFIGSPATDAVVVISEWNWDLMADRRERLERWVESGGRLVLDQTVFNIARLGDWCGIGRDDRGRLISRRPLIWLEKRTDEVRALRVRIGKGSVTVFDGDPYL
ncbi:MAG TPA: hypothetical protein VLX90_03455, partial [Steroidobacteraceae bacterium]|nr:hypothetical protein [Steroidobacteraceae bacterium]